MSVRHRNKLARDLGLDKLRLQESDDDEDEDNEEEQANAPVSAFQAFADSSDEGSDKDGNDSDDDGDDEDEEDAKAKQQQQAKASASARSRKKNKKKKQQQQQQSKKLQAAAAEQGDVDLDELIQEHKQQFLDDEADEVSGARGGYHGRQLQQVFTIDPKSLNVELELRRQFGGMSTAAADDGYAAPEGNNLRNPRRENRARVAAQSIIAKRCLFGAPHADWPQPPSFVAGGIGMKRCDAPSYLPTQQIQAHGPAQWFQFEWSGDYHQLQLAFHDVQATNDPNMLVVFLSRHPYHVEAAMQLAMVFARTGQMDRAADMVRRSLYMHECAYMEAFKPQNGNCRLDPQRPENAAYFAGLFRHMQIVGMQGCLVVSLQLARLLLSLDPFSDPMAALLALDYYCLQCKRHDLLESYFKSKLPLGYSHEQCELASTFDNAPNLTIADLPNWAFSMAASYVLRDDIENGMHAMKTAVYAHPYVVPILLSQCGVDATHTDPVDWSAVLKHEFFAGVTERLESSSVLLHLAEIYATRCQSIWQEEGLQLMLHRACLDVLEGVGPTLARHLASQQQKFSGLSSMASPLYKYRTALKEDFKDEYARLPPDMNPLDPRLVDPRVLAGRAVPAGHAPHMMQPQNLQGMLHQMLGQDEDAVIAQLLAQQHEAGEHGLPGNLDPNMPLLQLFLQTLMPWNEIDTTAEPAARNEGNPEGGAGDR